jgi:hypothetical protein
LINFWVFGIFFKTFWYIPSTKINLAALHSIDFHNHAKATRKAKFKKMLSEVQPKTKGCTLITPPSPSGNYFIAHPMHNNPSLYLSLFSVCLLHILLSGVCVFSIANAIYYNLQASLNHRANACSCWYLFHSNTRNNTEYQVSKNKNNPQIPRRNEKLYNVVL